MPTPHLYDRAGGYPADAVPLELRSSDVELLYATDRAPETDKQGALNYGWERSNSLAYGSVIIEIGKDTSWEELVRASETANRDGKLRIQVRSRRELGRFPETPRPFDVEGGRVVEDPEVWAEHQRVGKAFREEINRRLAISEVKEVALYIHGFNNSFDAAAIAMAEVWHFLGRQGVPVLYSWPAARGGLFGYFVDREAGEFTVFHLKDFIRLLVSFPEVEKIHLLAHSRGADVLTTALRELVIENRAAGGNPREDFRIANLVLAAPDLDYGVVQQRLMAERLGPAIGQITIYTAQADKALGLSESLMGGTRFGRVEASDIGERERQIFDTVLNVNIIKVDRVQSLIGHAYYRGSPAASSDMILVLRHGTPPGDDVRPLIHKVLNYWEMPDEYPNQPR